VADGYRTNDRRVIPWLLVGLIAVFGAMYAATYAYTAHRLPRGTSVEGVDIGGMRPAAARRALDRDIGVRAVEPLVVSAVGQRAVVRPAAAGLRVDIPGTLARIRTEPSWRPRRMWDWFAGGQDHPAVVTVDEADLARAVARLADRVDDPAVEGGVRFGPDGASARYPRPGTVVRRAAAVATLRRAFLHLEGPTGVVPLPTRKDSPRVGAEEVSRAMDAFANPALSGSVALRLHGRTERVRPAVYLPALRMRRDGSRLRPGVDAAVLARRLRPALLRVTGPRGHARGDASARARRLTVHTGRLARLVLRALPREGAARTVDLDGVVATVPAGGAPAAPAVTTAPAHAP
jgi:hypothetical protein